MDAACISISSQARKAGVRGNLGTLDSCFRACEEIVLGLGIFYLVVPAKEAVIKLMLARQANFVRVPAQAGTQGFQSLALGPRFRGATNLVGRAIGLQPLRRGPIALLRRVDGPRPVAGVTIRPEHCRDFLTRSFRRNDG